MRVGIGREFRELPTGGPAFGAALLAGVGAGIFDSVDEACRAAIHETAVIEPSRENGAYAPFRRVYEGLYADLKERFAQLLAAETR